MSYVLPVKVYDIIFINWFLRQHIQVSLIYSYIQLDKLPDNNEQTEQHLKQCKLTELKQSSHKTQYA